MLVPRIVMEENKKAAGHNAMQDAQTNAAQSANTAALATTMESIKAAETTYPDDENMMNDYKAANVVVKVLEENIDCLLNNPSSYKAQSYSLIACKKFLDPTNRFINTSKETLGNTIDENISLKKKETWNEAVISINNLEAQVDPTESSLANRTNPRNIETSSAVTSKIAKSLNATLLANPDMVVFGR